MIELSNLPWWITFPATSALLVMLCIVLIALYRALLIVTQAAISAARRAIETLTETFVGGIFAGARATGKLALGAGLLAAWPVAALWRVTGEPALARIDQEIQTFEQRRELKRLWRAEFRDQYVTFREFLDAFENEAHRQGQGKREARSERESVDEFVRACTLFGLPASGEFTASELKARYRKLIAQAHPDSGGANERAARINTARDLIMRRKGWK